MTSNLTAAGTGTGTGAGRASAADLAAAWPWAEGLALPGSDGYQHATAPRNSIAAQQPFAVVAAGTAGDVSAALSWASAHAVPVRVQASGHGAGSPVGADVLLVDTSRLNAIEVDPTARTVRVGAGATIGAVNAAVWPHALLFPGGTAPDVAVTGYTAWGGVGWLTRPHGLASASLIAVDIVDATGRCFTSDEDHEPDVLWAYRGGGGVGIATSLTFRLFLADALWAGYALWPVEQLAVVAAAWGSALPGLHPALSTAIALLHAPDAPTVPAALRGRPVVHLTAATVGGVEAGQTLLDVLESVPPPALQTFGPADAERLAGIHLDPPVAVPALGEGRWLTAAAAAHVAEILTAAGTGAVPLAELELRWVECPASAVDGAQTTTPGPLLLHVTGAGPDAKTRRATERALTMVLEAVDGYDTGRSAVAFCDGQPVAHQALGPVTLARLRRVRDRIDPDGVIGAARPLD